MNIFSTAWWRKRLPGGTVLPGRDLWRTLANDERRLERIRSLCVLVLIILLAQAAAQLVWAVMTPAPQPAPAIAAPAPERRPASRDAGAAAGAQLAALHLFGQPAPPTAPGEEAPAAAPAMIDAPETTLSLLLKGLLASPTGRRGLAVIAERGRGGGEEVYAIGDTVPGNAVIEAVYPDRVLLRRAGRLETLFLEDRDDEPPPTSVAPAGRSRAQSRAPAAPDRSAVSRTFVDESLANLPALARQVEVHIHNPEGGRHGFRLVAPGGSDFLDQLGLQPNDILYEVNGIPLSDAGAAMIAFEQLRNAREIRLEYEREGRPQSRTITIR